MLPTGARLDVFPGNVGKPAFRIALPESAALIDNTPQLALCIGLLLNDSDTVNQKVGPLLDVSSDPAARIDWVEAMKQDSRELDRLRWLAIRMVEEFVQDATKDSVKIAEIVALGPVLDYEHYRKLLSSIISGFNDALLLDVELLQGLVQLVQSNSPGYLDADDFIKILRILRTRLEGTHGQTSEYSFHLTLVVSRLLDVMAEHQVQDLSRVEDHEPLAGILSVLRGSSDPYLMYQACYAFQALQYVPDDETALQAVLRHSTGVASGLVKVSGLMKLDLQTIVEGLGDLQEAFGGVFGIASTAYEGICSVMESGRGVMDSLKEGYGSGKRRPWYAAIRAAYALAQAGQLKDLNQLVYEAPCRRDPLFQWGLCQLLGEIASDAIWDVVVRKQAIDLLGDLYKNDVEWGQDESIKTWMVNIIGQIGTKVDQAVSSHARALLKELEQGQGTTTTNLPYPLRGRLPLPPSSPLLACALAIPDIEYDLYKLRLQRLEEHRKAVYIPPLAKPSLQSSDDTLFSLMEKTLEFLASEKHVFLVLGDSGAGKSTFNLELEHTLWKDYKKYGPIPLFINLPTIDDPAHELIEKQLQYHNFSEDQIHEMKLHRQFVLICDGYDESQLKTNIHTTNQFNRPGQWQVKVVISCRTQYLGQDYRSRFQPQSIDRYQRVATDLFQEAVVAAFTRAQIQQYVDEFVKELPAVDPIQRRPTWSAEEYMDKLVNIPNLMDLVSNPFLLTLSLDALPAVVATKEDLSAIRITRVQLYDSFVKRWLEVNRVRLETSPLNSDERTELDMLIEDNFLYHGIHYQKDLATAIFIDHKGNPVVKYTHLREKNTWKAAFFNPSGQARLLRESSTVKRSGAFFRFLHRSLLEYFYSRTIYDPVDYVEEVDDGFDEREPGPDLMTCLARMNIVTEPSIVQFLAERVSQDSSFRQQLLDAVEASKANAVTEAVTIAAKNAITILVKAGVTFHGADLRGVNIPDADLSGGQFDCAQFQGADLRNVNLSRSWLRNADMRGAKMEGAHFGELPYLELERMVFACSYSPDGRMLAVGTGIWDVGVSIYDTSSWTETFSFTAPSSGSPITMAFSPDGTRFVYGGNDGLIRLRDCATGQEVFAMKGHSDCDMNSVTFSPCGKRIASSSNDKTVRVWDTQTGECLFVLEGHTDEVTSVKYSPDGEQLISGSRDKTVRFWGPENGEPGAVLLSSLAGVSSLAFSLDGRWIAFGHAGGGLQLWHAVSGEPGPVLHGHTRGVTSVAFSPDSRWMASSSLDGTIRLWDASTGTLIDTLSSHKTWVNDVVFSPNGLQIASGGGGDRRVRLWDVDSILTSSVEQQDQLGAVEKTVYSPNGQAVLTASHTTKQWDSLTGALVPLPIELPESLSVWSVSYPLNGLPVAAGLKEEAIWMLELQKGREETILEFSRTVRALTMSPCCRWIAFVDQDQTLTLWDVASAQQTHVLVENGGPTDGIIDCLAFSATGDQLAVGAWGGTIRLFDAQSGGLVSFNSTGWNITTISLSPDGQQLAVGTNEGLIYLWGLQSEEHVIELRGHTKEARCIAYSPCGEWIASGDDKTARVWRMQQIPGDTESWSCVSTVHGYFDSVSDIAWNPTVPMEFVTGCRDESVRVWRVSSDGEDVVITLLWGTNLAVLYAGGLVLKGTTGLGSTEQKLLVQCGAIDDSMTEGDKQDDYADSEGVESEVEE